MNRQLSAPLLISVVPSRQQLRKATAAAVALAGGGSLGAATCAANSQGPTRQRSSSESFTSCNPRPRKRSMIAGKAWVAKGSRVDVGDVHHDDGPVLGVRELKVLDLVTGGNRDPATPPKATLDASRATYEQEARPTNRRLPDWDTISTNREMRRAAKELTRVRTTLGRN